MNIQAYNCQTENTKLEKNPKKKEIKLEIFFILLWDDNLGCQEVYMSLLIYKILQKLNAIDNNLQLNQPIFPVLAEMACDVLVVPILMVKFEYTTFSIGGRVLNKL